MTMTRSSTSGDPRCWWCHDPTQDTRYIGEATDVVPLPAGVYVCTPACPARPEGVAVWKLSDWSTA